MIIWSRWGIVALLVPVAFVLAAQAVAKAGAAGAPAPTKRAQPAAETTDSLTEEDIEAAEKLVADQKKSAAEREKATKRAMHNGYGIGCLLGGLALWPLGRWMNRTERGAAVDPYSGNPVEVQVGGGHTLFFVPVEYWSLVWAGLGPFQFLSPA